MKCANPHCNAEGLYLRSGSLHTIDFVIADKQSPDGGTVSRKIVWLCGTCTELFAVETWRPPGQQLQPRNRKSTSTFRVRVAGMQAELTPHRLAS